MNRNIKKIVDILMVIFIFCALLTWEDDLTIHIIVGSITALLFFIHFYLNRKPLIAMIKANKEKKLIKKAKWKYIINMFLLVVWSIEIISGFLAIGYSVKEIDSLLVFSQIHSITTILGILLIIAHIIQHWSQIKSYIKLKKRIKIER